MVFIERWFLCFSLCWSGFCATSARVVKPNGYLSVNGESFSPSQEAKVYKFHEGEAADFTCRMTAGTLVMLYYNQRDENQNLLNFQQIECLKMDMKLRAGNNGTVVTCVIYDPLLPKEQAVIRLTLLLDNNKRVTSIWMIVFSVVGLLLLAAVGVWMWVSYKSRSHLVHNLSNLVTFAERNSVENLGPRAKDQNAYPEADARILASQTTYSSLQTGEPTDASSRNTEPNYSPVRNTVPNYLPVQNTVPV